MADNDHANHGNRKFAESVPRRPAPAEPLSSQGPPAADDLGPLAQLPGVWRSAGNGWNMVALPFQEAPEAPDGFKFRVLMNQYDEELKFAFVDTDVPNRGLLRPETANFDQFVATVDYQQKIAQRVAEDRPDSGGLAGGPGLPLHHEPGLWLYQHNRQPQSDRIHVDDVSQVNLDVARLASVPHGNAVLAMGTSQVQQGMPEIPPLGGMPSGRFEDVESFGYDFTSDPYLEPFRHYIEHPFMGTVTELNRPGFPGFSPADMNAILRFENQDVDIVRTTTLTVDSAQASGRVTNIPFSVREADAVSMKATFWIQELAETDDCDMPKLRMQYSQVVMLHFFTPRGDGLPGQAAWPHISIATLEKMPGGEDYEPA